VALGQPVAEALILGLCVAMSSSVVVVNITRSVRRRTNHQTETALLGWSLLQDLSGVILAAVLLAVWQADSRAPLESLVALGVFALVAVVAARVFPRGLRRLREYPDLFLLLSIAGGLVGAGIGAVVFDVPLALAAFVAGLVITDSPMANEARRRLLPFRDVFAVLFFVAVGSLLEPEALAGGLGWVVVFTGLLVLVKGPVVYLLARWVELERPAQVAVGLGQLGEFSFVLVSVLFAAGAVSAELNAGLLAVITLSIGASAVLARAPVPGWVRGSGEHRAGPASSAAGMA